jgi:hypothetical protein
LLGAALIYLSGAVLGLKMRYLPALFVGLLIGWGTRSGYKRAGGDVAIAGLILFGLAMFGGEFQAQKAIWAEDLRAIEEDQATAMAAFDDIEIDGFYSDEEVRALLGIEDDEWEDASKTERDWMRAEAADEFPAGEKIDIEPITFDPLTFGEFVSGLTAFIGIWGVISWILGAAEVWKICTTEV